MLRQPTPSNVLRATVGPLDADETGYDTSTALTVTTTGSTFHGEDGADVYRWTGRWASVNVPQGAPIASATLSITTEASTGTGGGGTMTAEDADDPASISGRGPFTSTWTMTTASVAMEEGVGGAGTADQDVQAIVQELVDRGGWAANNAMAFASTENVGATNYYWFESSGDANPPTLTITYVEGALSGTTSPNATESQVVSGGRTTIITLTDDTWVAAGATFDAVRQAIIDGCTSQQSETNGWNNEVRDNEVVGSVVRTSDTVVTITWTAAGSYAITADETIDVIVPASALTLANAQLDAGSFTVSNEAGGGSAIVPLVNAQML